MFTKIYPDIWTFVRTQETHRTRQAKTLFRTRWNTSEMRVFLTVKTITGDGLCAGYMSMQEAPTTCCNNTFPVSTPCITSSCSSVPPSFLVFIVVLVRPFKIGDYLREILKISAIWRVHGSEFVYKQKVIIVHPQTRYWSPVDRTLKLFLTFFLKEKIQTQETGRPFVPVPFRVFLRGRFSNFFWSNRNSKIGVVEGVSDKQYGGTEGNLFVFSQLQVTKREK